MTAGDDEERERLKEKLNLTKDELVDSVRKKSAFLLGSVVHGHRLSGPFDKLFQVVVAKSLGVDVGAVPPETAYGLVACAGVPFLSDVALGMLHYRMCQQGAAIGARMAGREPSDWSTTRSARAKHEERRDPVLCALTWPHEGDCRPVAPGEGDSK